jgi:hypothetical protein
MNPINLNFLLNLSEEKKTEIVFRGVSITIEIDLKNKNLILSSLIFSEKFYVSREKRKYCFFCNLLLSKKFNPSLKFDQKAASVFLIQEIPCCLVFLMPQLVECFFYTACFLGKKLKKF